ncbi:MAG: hypothetical protein B7733_00700 [Myxococcales bacterium FL481]|nr:MAG: hypothetical protein B7733_00700 [Myxococcales bacterium FL481]
MVRRSSRRAAPCTAFSRRPTRCAWWNTSSPRRRRSMIQESEIRTVLTEQLHRLRARAKRIDDHQHNRDRELPQDFSELATHRDHDEVVDALDTATRRDIRRIETALRRLEAGIWRTCVRCEGDIEEARLLSIPTVTQCRECAAIADGLQ